MVKSYFDGVAFEDFGITVERVHDPIPEMREELEAKPNGHGSFLNSLTMSPRNITLECRYFGEKWLDFDEMLDDISAWLITDDDRELRLRNHPTQHYLAHYVTYEEGDREGGTGIGAFTLQFTASDPIRFGESRALVVQPSSYKAFEVGGTDMADLTITVRNVQTTSLTVSFIAPDGSTPSLTVTSQSASSRTVELDCVNHVCKNNGKVAGTTLTSVWPQLVPGAWKVKTSAGTATLSWTQRCR